MTAAPSGFAARLHGPGLRPSGEPVLAWIDAAGLHVKRDRHLLIAPDRLVPSIGGFSHDTLFLAWEEGGGQLSVEIPKADFAALRAAAPPELAARFAKLGGGVRRQRWMWRAVGGIAAALALFAVLAALRYERVVAWAAARIPPSVEADLGNRVVDDLRAQGTLVEEGPAVEALRTIGARLVRDSRYTYRWYVLDDDDVNAFAAPGGAVVVYRGLIAKAASPEEVAGVLAHEIQHVEQRHTLRSTIASLGWGAVLMIALGDTSTMAGLVLHRAGAMSYSRDLEREADSRGMESLAAAHLPPAAMIDFFAKLEAGEADALAFLASHPATAERIASLRRDAGRLGTVAVEPLAVDWPAVQASLPQARPAR